MREAIHRDNPPSSILVLLLGATGSIGACLSSGGSSKDSGEGVFCELNDTAVEYAGELHFWLLAEGTDQDLCSGSARFTVDMDASPAVGGTGTCTHEESLATVGEILLAFEATGAGDESVPGTVDLELPFIGTLK